MASKAQARLTTAIKVKAARSRHPGLNFSISSALARGLTSSGLASDLISVPSEPAGGSMLWLYCDEVDLEGRSSERKGKEMKISLQERMVRKSGAVKQARRG